MVCKAEYCEMDVWKMIIASFQAASTPGMVTVLGAVDGPTDTTASEYDTLGTAAVGHTAAGSSGAPVDGFSRLLIEGGGIVGGSMAVRWAHRDLLFGIHQSSDVWRKSRFGHLSE